jgi:hypothetical protein
MASFSSSPPESISLKDTGRTAISNPLECSQCLALRKKGKFPKKCVHGTKPLNIVASRSKSLEIDSETEISSGKVKRVGSLSRFFPELLKQTGKEFYSGLTESDFLRYNFSLNSIGEVELKIALFDHPGAVFLVTGLCASFNLDIRSGSVLRKPSVGATIAFIVAKLDGSCPDSGFGEVRQMQFIKELKELYQELVTSRETATQRLLIRTFHSRTQLKADFKLRPLKVTLSDYDDFFDSKTIACTIEAEDTVGFLFFLCTALSLRDLQIDGIVIESYGSVVHDVLYLDPVGLKTFDKVSLRRTLEEELSTAISILQNFTQALTVAPDPVQALKSFDQLLNTFERASMESELTKIMHEQTLKRLALILGSSTFLYVRSPDFLT